MLNPGESSSQWTSNGSSSLRRMFRAWRTSSGWAFGNSSIPECTRNAFSPNGDGINENWVVYDNRSCLKNVTVTVFNRYGNQVYENVDYFNNWNGTYKGKPLPAGTYYYIIDLDGLRNTKKGYVTILR